MKEAWYLVCTAGLPALDTEILASRSLPAWKRRAYLALYDVAYMLDDMIRVGIAVVSRWAVASSQRVAGDGSNS